jgi:chemotaxis protein CheD
MTTFAPALSGTFGAAPQPADATQYVHPGRIASSMEAASFTTIVGSGVAVCIWDPLRHAGGVAHFLLPEAGNAPAAPRYGDVAMKKLVDELAALGASARGLRARVYGGSAPPIAAESGHLGDRNVAAALAFLEERGIPLLERDVGGNGARKVVFQPTNGSVEVTRVGG